MIDSASRTSALALLSLFALCVSLSAAPPLEKRSEETHALPADAELSVRNTDGTIYIYGSEVNELKVYARKKAYSQARLDGISVKIAIQGKQVVIETIFPPTPKGLSVQDRSGTVDYVIVAPQTCTIARAELVNGEIILDGLRGPAVNARLTNGIIMVGNCFTALQLTAAQGGIDVYYDWWEEGEVSLQAELAQGNVRVALPPDPSVRLDAASVSGNVSNQFGQEHGQSNGRSVRTTIGADGGGEFKIRTTSGNIKIERAY